MTKLSKSYPRVPHSGRGLERCGPKPCHSAVIDPLQARPPPKTQTTTKISQTHAGDCPIPQSAFPSPAHLRASCYGSFSEVSEQKPLLKGEITAHKRRGFRSVSGASTSDKAASAWRSSFPRYEREATRTCSWFVILDIYKEQ